MMCSPSCLLSVAEQILSYMGIHWQLLVYLVLWTVLPQEIKPVTPVRGAFWHQVLYERSLLVCSPGHLVHSQDCSFYMKKIMSFRGLFLHHQALQTLLPGSQGTHVQHRYHLLPLPHFDILPMADRGESAALTKTEEQLTLECMCHTHRQLHPLIPCHSQLGINKNLWFCFQRTQTAPPHWHKPCIQFRIRPQTHEQEKPEKRLYNRRRRDFIS